MDCRKVYHLEPWPRLFHYPYRLGGFGWLPHHMHIHDHAEVEGCFVCLTCNYEATSKILLNDTLCINEPGQPPHFSILTPGETLHTLLEAPHDEIFFHYTHDAAKALLDFLPEELLAKKTFYFQGFPQEILSEIRQEISDMARPWAADRLDQLAIRLITDIVFSRQIQQEEENSHNMKLHTIAAELYRGRSLASLLPQYGYSERTFYREWEKVFTESPKEHVLHMRLKHACSMLAGSNRSISMIAEECGFGSTTYFHRIFQTKLKMTPLAFRKKQSKELFASVEIPLYRNGNAIFNTSDGFRA